MPQIDPVILQLRADLADYNAKTSQAVRLADQRLGAIEKRGFQMGQNLSKGFSLASKAAVTFAAGIGVMGIVELGKQAVETSLRFKRFEQGLAVATGSASKAGAEMAFLRDMADKLGLRFITLAESFTGIAAAARGTALEGQATRDVFEAVTKAIVATGGSAEQTEGALLAIQQMISKGKVSAEELTGQLGERLPGAFQIAARAMGVTTAELGKMLEQGEVLATDFLPKLAAQLGKELPAALQTADAAFQRFQTALDDIANSTADGFMRQLGDATDDLTATLKDLQHSGALEAIGSFLGEVIRLGAGAAQVIGNLALAWRRFHLQRGSDLQQNVIDGWFTSDEQKEKARLLKARFDGELDRMANPGKKSAFETTKDSAASFAENWWGEKPASSTPSTAGGGKKTSKRRSGQSQAQMEARREAELARLQQDELRAKYSVATDAAERADLAKEILFAERAEMIQRLTASKALTKEARETIDRIYGAPATTDADGTIVNPARPGLLAQQINRDLEEQQTRLANEQLGRQASTLEAWADIETNTKQRRNLEESALSLHQLIERNLLEQEIESGKIAASYADQARNALESQQIAERIALDRRNMSPGQRFQEDLRSSAENINDSIEAIQVDGLQSLNDGIVEAIMGTKSLGEVFKNVAAQIVADLIRIAVQKTIVNSLGNMLFGGGGSSLSPVNFDAISQAASGVKLPGFAKGTNSAPRGLAIVGEDGPEVVRFRGGEQVIPNHLIGSTAARSDTSVTQHITIKVDAQGALLASQVTAMVQKGIEVSAQIGVNGGGAEGERRVMSRGRRRIPG